MKEIVCSKACRTVLQMLGIVLVLVGDFFLFLLPILMIMGWQVNVVLACGVFLILPALLLPLIWCPRRYKRILLGWGIFMVLYAGAIGLNLAVNHHNDRITINTTPNINVYEYLPFEEESKIIKLENEASLRFTVKDDLPVVDGAAAVFPVYSAFVNAVYPNTKDSILPEGIKSTELYDGIFEYNNTVRGYRLLAERQTDIFFGAYPSAEQIAYAEEQSTTFVYTPIGADAFVFFVHKDNPIDNLTSEQIRKIYSGEITNWKDAGGKNEKIAAFQRNEGSGSQSMLLRFMGDTPVMEAPTEMVNDLMAGIIEQVADYKSKSGSIGFSFRYYMEGIIKNPDVKLLSVDGIAPTPENIKSGTYPITGPLYAVTYEENDNENVQRLLDWILSPEGQEIIEKTGYAGVQTP